MTCDATSSPTRPAASLPASTAARTLPTSPRTIVVTNAPPIWIVLTISTLAALVIASVASTSATQPFVSTNPRALPYEPFSSAIAVSNSKGTTDGHRCTRIQMNDLCSSVFICGFISLPCARCSRRDARADLALGHHSAQLIVRAGDDVHADDLSDAAGGFGAGVDGGLHRRNVSAHERRHHAAAGLVPPHHFHVRRLEHRIAALNQGDEAFAFEQT